MTIMAISLKITISYLLQITKKLKYLKYIMSLFFYSSESPCFSSSKSCFSAGSQNEKLRQKPEIAVTANKNPMESHGGKMWERSTRSAGYYVTAGSFHTSEIAWWDNRLG